MILPMFGFIAALLVVGSLGTLVAVGDPRNARLAHYIGFGALFSGLGALSFSVILSFIGWVIFEPLAGIGLLAGFMIGGLAGAVFGFYRAGQRRHRIEQSHDLSQTVD